MGWNPIPEHLLRVLRYIDLVEHGGGHLTDRDIDVFSIAEVPESGAAGYFGNGLSARLSTYALLSGSGVSDYMRAVGWLTDMPPRLTSAGRAIVAAAQESQDRAADDAAGLAVLSPTDPLNLASLTRSIASARGGTLVDPYFTDDLFPWLIEATSIARVLLCREKAKRSVLGFYSGGAATSGRPLEIRCLGPRELHDRYLIAEDESVSMIGASLNGLHRNFTAIVPIPDPAATAVREYVRERWEEADPIEPRTELAQPDDEGAPETPLNAG